jgi:hypothetical protein
MDMPVDRGDLASFDLMDAGSDVTEIQGHRGEGVKLVKDGFKYYIQKWFDNDNYAEG